MAKAESGLSVGWRKEPLRDGKDNDPSTGGNEPLKSKMSDTTPTEDSCLDLTSSGP